MIARLTAWSRAATCCPWAVSQCADSCLTPTPDTEHWPAMHLHSAHRLPAQGTAAQSALRGRASATHHSWRTPGLANPCRPQSSLCTAGAGAWRSAAHCLQELNLCQVAGSRAAPGWSAQPLIWMCRDCCSTVACACRHMQQGSPAAHLDLAQLLLAHRHLPHTTSARAPVLWFIS